MFQNRFLLGETPDIEDASNADLLRRDLNQRAVEVAHLAYEVGDDLGDLDLDAESVHQLRAAAKAIEELADEAEDEFT